MSAEHQMAGLNMASQGFATLSNLDMQQCPKIVCNFVQKVLAKNTAVKNRVLWHKPIVLFLSGCLCMCAMGLVFGTFMNLGNKTSGMILIQSTDFMTNLGNCIVGFFLLFQAFPFEKTLIFSKPGLIYLCKIGFVLIFVLCVYWGYKTDKKIKSKAEKIFLLISAMITGVNLFIFIFSNTTYGSPIFESRYYIVVYIFNLIVFAVFLNHLAEKQSLWKPLLAVSLVPCILLSGYVGYRWLTFKDETTPYLFSLIDQVETFDPDTIIIFSEDESDFPFVHTRRMQAYDLGRDYAQIRPVNKDDYSEEFFADTFVKPKRFTNNSGYPGRNLLIVREDAWEKLPDKIKNTYTLMDTDEEFLYFVTDDCPFFKE